MTWTALAPSLCHPSSPSPCVPRMAARTRGRCPSKLTWERLSCSAPTPPHHLHTTSLSPSPWNRPWSRCPMSPLPHVPSSGTGTSGSSVGGPGG